MAQVRRPIRTWSPKLEVNGVPIAYDASLRHYRGGHAGHVAEALKQPLLLPKDMEAIILNSSCPLKGTWLW